MKISTSLANTMAEAYRTALNGGLLYIFSGTTPAGAEDALDMAADHTALCTISTNGGGTGLAWDAASNGAILKPSGDTWEGVNVFTGTTPGAGTLQATFARFCPPGDNGQGAGSGDRVQFCISGPSGICEMLLSSTSITDDGASGLSTSVDFARILVPTE